MPSPTRPSGSPEPPGGRAESAPRGWRPPPALLAFLALLAVVFVVSYQVGDSVGPVAPGMRSSTSDGDGGSGGGSGGGHGGGHGGHG
ncbi:hypothetical protein AB0I84_13405 [Streptomyces spectabilis]|uniref:hypothetical protein n=1 Tax=Streptomyces spectabilis TaxID=68270 RepID=UPI0033F6DB7F